jgi:tripartite-type tricarboxylate transporter receptor subunit TctC
MTSLKSKLLGVCLLALSAGTAFAQAWPPATVRIVVPYPPGSEPDVLARDLGASLAKQTGKTFVVDNKPGANSIIGTGEVVKGDSDGSVLLMVDRLAVVTNPVLYNKLPYKWEESLKPVSDLAGVRLFIAVRDSFPAGTYAEFLRYAKEHPGKVTVGTGGNGHVTHIGMAMVAQAHGLSFSFVPYKGVVPAMQDLLAGQVDAVMAGGLVMQAQAAGKRIRVLVVGDDKRAAVLPDVPSLAEAGGAAGSIPSTVFSLLAPAKVPDAVVGQISAAVAKAMGGPDVKSSYAAKGLDVGPTTPVKTLALMKEDAPRFEKIIRDAGIKLE